MCDVFYKAAALMVAAGSVQLKTCVCDSQKVNNMKSVS